VAEKSEQEKRSKERVLAALPVTLGSGTGVTRDVSATGMFFETTATLDSGSVIGFSVEFDTPTGKMVLHCKGNIVRTERRNNRLGVAVNITESTIETSLVPGAEAA